MRSPEASIRVGDHVILLLTAYQGAASARVIGTIVGLDQYGLRLVTADPDSTVEAPDAWMPWALIRGALVGRSLRAVAATFPAVRETEADLREPPSVSLFSKNGEGAMSMTPEEMEAFLEDDDEGDD